MVRAPRLVLVFSCVLTGAVAAQSRNVELLGRFDPGSRGSDIWGYVDPATGVEYALLGTYDGTHVLDCSDPRNPVHRGLIPTDSPGASGNRWQDIKVYGSYAYVVSEAYGGVQIIDLSNPDNPTKVKTWGSSLWSNTHNIAMDFDTGIAYACGTPNGTHVLDVATDPVNPVRLAVYTRSSVHDLAIQDGMAHTAEISANRYTILDVSRLPSMPVLSTTNSAGRSSCHSMWPSRDNQIAALCHETSGGEVVVYDIRNPRLPVFLSKFQTGGSSAIVHNPMVVDRVCHISWNTEGYQALDLSDPANPVRVGFYDTWSGASSGFNGMWGVFATQPSGIVYGMDRTAGFFAFKPKCTTAQYGEATSGDHSPALHAFGAAWVGNDSFAFEVEGAAPTSGGLLILGQSPASQSFQELSVLVDLGQPYVGVSLTTDAEGTARITAGIPMSAPADVKLYAQAFVLDGGAPLGVSASRGMEIDLFAR